MFNKRLKGRVIVGPGSEPLSQEMMKRPEQPTLISPELETQFWQRVRLRVEEKAREIMATSIREAEEIKARARKEGFEQGYKEGYAKGLKEGQEEGHAKGHAEGYTEGLAKGEEEARKEVENNFAKEMEELKEDLSTRIAHLLADIDGQKEKIWNEFKEELVLLTIVSVEKIFNITLNDHKKEILNSLFDQAMDQLEDKRELCIKVNPDDAEIMQEVLEKARAEYPQLDKWQLKADPAIELGGVILENEDSIINNTIDVRYAEVKKIVDQLDVE